MKQLFIISLALLFASCSETPTQDKTVESKLGGHQAPLEHYDENSSELLDAITDEIKTNSSRYSYAIIENDHDQGYGYQIYKDGTMLISQKHIPSVPGVKGFETKEKATIAADYILQQVETGNFPPTVNRKILDSLKVL
jgi:hypothetical protein